LSEQEKISKEADTKLRTEPLHYALVDLATATGLRPIIGTLPPSTALTLFAENTPQKLAMHGPWLVNLSKSPETKEGLDRLGNRVAWGYYINSTFEIVSLRQSLRKFNVVQLGNARKEVMFRYWDPRVMRTFLDISTRNQRDKFFELITSIDIDSKSFDTRGETGAQQTR
jgi:hypothetical protein